MPKVVFSYLPFKARGEPNRLLLAYGGVDFEYRRISYEDFDKIRHTTPFGKMPVLEIDGKQYAQSYAMARYLGRKYGLAGKDIEEDFEIDQNVAFVNDICTKGHTVHYEPDAAYKAKKHEDFTKNVYPALLSKLDKMIKENDGHIACSRLTWADFVFAGTYAWLKLMLQRDLDELFPSFKQLEQLVYTLPRVKEFADAALKTDF